jgi:carbonic anhydrase
MMEYLFNVQKVVVVHHALCGLTSFTPELFNEEFRDHYHVDISKLFDPESVAILDYEKSLKYDIELLRSSPAVPKHIKLYGFFYDINSGTLTEVVKDIPA